MTGAAENVVSRFLSELETWQAEHRGWTEAAQLHAFPLRSLWVRAGGGTDAFDRALYVRLMEVAGYVRSVAS